MRLVTALREVWNSLSRNPVMALAAISTCSISLVTFGLFLAIQLTLVNIARGMAEKVEINLFLVPGTPHEKAVEIQNRIRGYKEVGSVIYVTPEEGLAEMKKSMGEELVDDILEGENPLPGRLTVKVKDPLWVEQVVQFIKPLSGVDEIRYGKEDVKRVSVVSIVFGFLGWSLILVMLGATYLIVANTIQLTVDARKKEIRIMQLVGATDWYIRLPFMLEGVFYGLVGACLGATVVGLAYYGFYGLAQRNFPFVFPLLSPEVFNANLLLVPLVGASVGLLGSLSSMKNALREST